MCESCRLLAESFAEEFMKKEELRRSKLIPQSRCSHPENKIVLDGSSDRFGNCSVFGRCVLCDKIVPFPRIKLGEIIFKDILQKKE